MVGEVEDIGALELEGAYSGYFELTAAPSVRSQKSIGFSMPEINIRKIGLRSAATSDEMQE